MSDNTTEVKQEQAKANKSASSKKLRTQSNSPTSKSSKSKEVVTPSCVVAYDGGRSKFKLDTYLVGETESRFIKVPSALVKTEVSERIKGAFTVSRSIKTDEQKVDKDGKLVFNKQSQPVYKTKTVKEHWIVGNNATNYPGCFWMEDDSDNKERYFCQGFYGALANLGVTRLNEMSNPKVGKDKEGNEFKKIDDREIPIYLVVLSIASGQKLIEDLKKYCSWFQVDGIKYKVKFVSCISYSEGYGAALYAKVDQKCDEEIAVVSDLGCGTFQNLDFDFSINLPLLDKPRRNGSGGIGMLLDFFEDYATNSDIYGESLSRSTLNQILETSRYQDSKITATTTKGSDLSGYLNLAIDKWFRDSTARKAIDQLIMSGRSTKLFLCGGGFQIEPVREIIKQKLMQGGVPKENIHVCKDAYKVGITYTAKYHAEELANGTKA